MTLLHVLETTLCDVYDQLVLEERLLRGDSRNICLINYGSSPAIVMGISGKEERAELPQIRRFSGGGTVVVDEDTIFITFIFNKLDIDVLAEPKAIMQWTGTIYEQVFQEFSLLDNDYVFGTKKFAGNAQYIKKDRWLHHSTFLWDYCETRMQMLRMPERMPHYREKREHLDFLTTLKARFADKKAIGEAVKEALRKSFTLVPFEERELPLTRQATEKIR